MHSLSLMDSWAGGHHLTGEYKIWRVNCYCQKSEHAHVGLMRSVSYFMRLISYFMRSVSYSMKLVSKYLVTAIRGV